MTILSRVSFILLREQRADPTVRSMADDAADVALRKAAVGFFEKDVEGVVAA